MKKRGQLRITISFSRIERQNIILLCTVKDFLLIFRLHILRHKATLFYLYTSLDRLTVLAKFCKHAAKDIPLFIFLYFFWVTGLLCQGFYLLINLLLTHLDCIIIDRVFVCKFNLEFWCKSDIKSKFKFILIFDILSLLLLIW